VGPEPRLSDAKCEQLRQNLEWWVREIEAGRPLIAPTVVGILRDVITALTPEPRPPWPRSLSDVR
jgi:hypothetical protein